MSSNKFNFTSTLTDEDLIEVAVNKSFNSPSIKDMRLYEDKRFVSYLQFLARSESQSTYIYSFSFNYPLIPGKLYELFDGRNESSPLNITFLAHTKRFEKTYRDDGDFGALYSKEATTFRLFSPLATEGIVKLISLDGKISYLGMMRSESGVLEATVKGDIDGYGYIYIVRINGEYVTSVDPWARSVGLNSQIGYVVDINRLDDIPLNEEGLPPFSDPCKAVIYELDIRDMTSLTDLPDKGTFNALSEEGLKDKSGNPIGLDYVASLGVTHVQFLPVFDFQTIRDDDPKNSYNWGYDPIFYFAVEGSYSSDPSSPYVRMRELRHLVSQFHKKGIRVNMDVVFNHTMSFLTSAFNRLCPGYYYRYNSDGALSASSGCGNDTESRNYMFRKLIIDNLMFFAKVYGIDGYRFDLMGILDSDTIREAYFALKGFKPSMMMYGEGWDMPTFLDPSEKANMNNAFQLKDIGFFNDRFRDVVRGRSYGKDMSQKGYLTGDINYVEGFKHVFLGSVITYAFPPLFDSPKQSINYVECHDDGTLFDKISACCPDDSYEEVLKRIGLINVCTIFAYGVAFIHSGQEYGHSKCGVTNTYNLGDKYNGFDYKEAYKNENIINLVKDAIELKKKISEASLSDKKLIARKINFEDLSNGGVTVKYGEKEDKIHICLIINPSKTDIKYVFPGYYKVLFDKQGIVKDNIYTEFTLVSGLSALLAVSYDK